MLNKEEKTKTCYLAIVETMDHINKNEIDQAQNQSLLIVVSDEYAVEWSRPVDISWHDLANGKVKPYTFEMPYSDSNEEGILIAYYGGYLPIFVERPKNYQEWEKLFSPERSWEKIN